MSLPLYYMSLPYSTICPPLYYISLYYMSLYYMSLYYMSLYYMSLYYMSLTVLQYVTRRIMKDDVSAVVGCIVIAV